MRDAVSRAGARSLKKVYPACRWHGSHEPAPLGVDGISEAAHEGHIVGVEGAPRQSGQVCSSSFELRGAVTQTSTCEFDGTNR